MNFKIEINTSRLTNICPYCLGSGKLKAMQSAVAYNGKSIRVKDTTVKCNNCNGSGYID